MPKAPEGPPDLEEIVICGKTVSKGDTAKAIFKDGTERTGKVEHCTTYTGPDGKDKAGIELAGGSVCLEDRLSDVIVIKRKNG